jgi:multiple sugar transport system permease protein
VASLNPGTVSSKVALRPDRPADAPAASQRRGLGGPLVKHSALLVISLIFVFPLLWMALTSLKPLPEAVTFPPVWVPHPWIWGNYPAALKSEDFARFFYNTLFYCVTTVVGVLVASSLVAYGFSRFEWPGRDVLFYVMISTLLLPFIVTLIPLFVLYKNIGWVGSYKPLIIPTFFASSVFSTFLLRQFFLGIPRSISDAARVDGANEFYIYWRIVLPLAKPALAAVALFQFVYSWNDFLGPLIYLNSSSLYPLSLGLYEMLGIYTTNWTWLMAAATCATIPMIVLFFLTQKTFIQGITVTGMRE